jgi:hypothetical protein
MPWVHNNETLGTTTRRANDALQHSNRTEFGLECRGLECMHAGLDHSPPIKVGQDDTPLT